MALSNCIRNAGARLRALVPAPLRRVPAFAPVRQASTVTVQRAGSNLCHGSLRLRFGFRVLDQAAYSPHGLTAPVSAGEASSCFDLSATERRTRIPCMRFKGMGAGVCPALGILESNKPT